MLKKYKNILFVGVVVLYLLSSVRFFDNVDYWLIDIFSHFLFLYSILAFILLIVCLWRKVTVLAVLAGLLLLLNLGVLLDIGGSVQASSRNLDSFTVYSANIHKKNMELSALKSEILEINPEIVLLLEITPGHKELIDTIAQAYPYRLQNINSGVLGFVFLSKFSVKDYNVTTLSKYGNSLLEAMLEINEKTVMFYGLHAQRPRFGNYEERVNQLLRLARQINEQSFPAIVAGDFNTTPYSPLFREVINIAGLKDSREGFGWQPSWPTYVPPFWIPIDHVLVTSDIQVRMRETGSYIGSDHYPVITELSLG